MRIGDCRLRCGLGEEGLVLGLVAGEAVLFLFGFVSLVHFFHVLGEGVVVLFSLELLLALVVLVGLVLLFFELVDLA